MDHKKIALLEISCWAGYSIGATHYYGKIFIHDKDGHLETFEVKTKLSPSMCASLNKKEREYAEGYRYTHRVGDENGRYDTREQVIEAAITVFLENGLDKTYRYLVVGRYASVESRTIVWAKVKSVVGKIMSFNGRIRKGNKGEVTEMLK